MKAALVIVLLFALVGCDSTETRRAKAMNALASACQGSVNVTVRMGGFFGDQIEATCSVPATFMKTEVKP